MLGWKRFQLYKNQNKKELDIRSKLDENTHYTLAGSTVEEGMITMFFSQLK